MPSALEPLKPNLGRAGHGRRARRRRSRIENLFFGVALATFGIVAWGLQQDLDWAESFYDWWPLLLAWIGLGKLLAGRFVPGIALATGGGLAFLHLRGLADLEYTWPLILVAVGVAITIGAVVSADAPSGSSNGPATTPEQEDDHEPA